MRGFDLATSSCGAAFHQGHWAHWSPRRTASPQSSDYSGNRSRVRRSRDPGLAGSRDLRGIRRAPRAVVVARAFRARARPSIDARPMLSCHPRGRRLRNAGGRVVESERSGAGAAPVPLATRTVALVRAVPAVLLVRAGAAVERVVPVATVQTVVPGSTRKRVLPAAAGDRVVATAYRRSHRCHRDRR